jgi:VIT1/CCC1 family predicted Fe2+/Mn2+ transporter
VALLIAASAILIILPVVIGMYEARYALPALPLSCIAGALSLHHLLSARSELNGEP